MIQKGHFLKSLSITLATGFGVGRLPWAPGTWGSLFALPFVWLFVAHGNKLLLLIAIIAVSLGGIWAASVYEKYTGLHDSSEIVIDEVAGQWITFLLIPADMLQLSTWYWYVAGFCLFRFFDILKPWPIGWLDKNMPGGFGVMIDDILAGLMATVVLLALHSMVILW